MLRNRWLGTQVYKNPLDQWMYQEILWDTKPDVILEMGTFRGGSALYLATIFDLMNHGRIITVDIEKFPGLPVHPRITYLTGSSTSDVIVSQIKNLIQPGERVMVVLDSDHHKPHVLNELRIYSHMVSPGQYLIVEDTNIAGHPVFPEWPDEGPDGAATDFLKDNPNFVPDRSRERLMITASPRGWLKRVR